MKITKKVLSVFLCAAMMMLTLSVGFSAGAADLELDSQYTALAAYLKNDWVRTRDNYTITNSKAPDSSENEGFNTDSNGFTYVHKVVATDDADKDILKAANRFYYILEKLKSTDYGTGYYSPDLLYKEVIAQLDKKFAGMETDYTYNYDGTHTTPVYEYYCYEDFYGKELTVGSQAQVTAGSADISYDDVNAYNKLVASTSTATADNNYYVSEAILTENRLYFRHVTAKTYYSYDSIIGYFMGTCTLVNSGNWYHKFFFIDTTNIESAVLSTGSLKDWTGGFDNITAAYELTFSRYWDAETGTKAEYAFAASADTSTLVADADTYLRNDDDSASLYPVLDTGVSNYAAFNQDGDYVTLGQAANLLVMDEMDTTTYPYLVDIVNYFTEGNEIWLSNDNHKWASMSSTDLTGNSYAKQVRTYYKYLSSTYSDDFLNTVFKKGDDGSGTTMGDIAALAQLAQPNTEIASRVVRNGVTYTATTSNMSTFITNFDALMQNSNLGSILNAFLPTTASMFVGSPTYGKTYETPKQLVQLVLKSKLYTGDIVNKLMKLIYPTLHDLLQNAPTMVYDAMKDSSNIIVKGLAGTVKSLLSNIITDTQTQNEIDLTPSKLGEDISSTDYPIVHNMLINTKDDSWDNVDWDNLKWNLDGTVGDFNNALTQMLLGLKTLLAAAFTTEDYNIVKVATTHIFLCRVEGYQSLLIPIFRALGLTEYTGDPSNVTGYSDKDAALPDTFWSNHYLSYSAYCDHVYKGVTRTSDHNAAVDAGQSVVKDVLGPILYWLDNTLIADPIGTLTKLLPNVAYFLGKQIKVDGNYATYNLTQLLNSIELSFGIMNLRSLYTLKVSSLIEGKLDVSSINTLLNSFVTLKYDTGVASTTQKVVAYTYDDGSHATVAGSDTYLANQASYTKSYKTAYLNKDPNADGFNINDASLNVTINRTTAEDETNFPYKYEAYYTTQVTYKLPTLQDNKLIECGTPNLTSSSPTYGTLTVSSDQEGQCLQYVLRFVLSALLYRYVDSNGKFTTTSTVNDQSSTTEMKYSLIECFKLSLSKTLFNGLTLGEIIYNVDYRADDALCALLQILVGNEHGNYYDYYIKSEGAKADTYPVTDVNYYSSILLNTDINPTLTFGNGVTYSKYWTQKDANYVAQNIGTLVDNVLDCLKLKGFENGVNGFIANLAGKFLTDTIAGTLISAAFGALYKLTETNKIDINTILTNVLGVNMATDYAANQVKDQMNDRMANWGITNYDSTAYQYLHSLGEDATWADVFFPIAYEQNTDGTYALDSEGNKIPIIATEYATDDEGNYLYDGEGNHILVDKYTTDANGNKHLVYEHQTVSWEAATQSYCAANNLSAVSFGFITVGDDGTVNNPLGATYGGKEINSTNFTSGLTDIVFKYNLEIFENLLIGLFSPASFLTDFLFYDKDINIFNLIDISAYAGYQNALAPLFDALDLDGVVSYKTAYENTIALQVDDAGNAKASRNSLYYVLDPIVKFVEQVETNPIEELLTRIPNLFFFASIGGPSSVVNNLVHPFYVLLDIVKPVLNVYDVINSLLANLKLQNVDLNLRVPLDIDINQIVNGLIEGLMGAKGIDVYTDKTTGAVLHLALPYIDLTTLCAGTLKSQTSTAQSRDIVVLNSAGGGDLVTALYRIVVQVLFMKQNRTNVETFLTTWRSLDGYDNETLTIVLDYIFDFMQKNELPDKTMQLIATLMRKVVPVTSNLAVKFNNVDFSIVTLLTTLGASITSQDFTAFDNMMNQLDKYGTTSPTASTLSGFAKLFAQITALFQKILSFFQQLFSGKATVTTATTAKA